MHQLHSTGTVAVLAGPAFAYAWTQPLTKEMGDVHEYQPAPLPPSDDTPSNGASDNGPSKTSIFQKVLAAVVDSDSVKFFQSCPQAREASPKLAHHLPTGGIVAS